MLDYKNERGLIWRDMNTWLSYIYIHVFVCDLAKGACYTQKKTKTYSTAERERERERERETRDDRLSYIPKFVWVWDDKRQAQ